MGSTLPFSKLMKTQSTIHYLLSSILVLFLLGLTGCKTGGSLPSAESIQSKAKGIAYLVTAETLRERPEWAEHFKIASYEFQTLAASTNVTLQSITAIVTQLPTKQLKGERVQIYLTVGALFLQDDLGEIALTQPEELRRAAQGAHEGIDMALAKE
jgi:hypothetical protein